MQQTEEIWDPYQKEPPRFQRPKMVYIVSALIVMITVGVVSFSMNFRRTKQAVALITSPRAVSEPLPIKGHDLGPYTVENLSARYKGELRASESEESVDIYEVTGLVRRKDANAPPNLTLKVEMRSGVVRIHTAYESIKWLARDVPRSFKIEVKDPTQALSRQADLNFIVSAEQHRAMEGEY